MASNPACKTFIPRLSPFIDGELPPSERQDVERHVASCQTCAGRVADLRAEAGLVRVGMEMATDDVDFSRFAQNVMARITPERPPLLERVKLVVSELFTYQRGTFVAGLAAAAVVALVAVPFLMRSRYPEGYAQQKMQLVEVSTNPDAHVSPVVLNTEEGDAIIWLVDHADHDEKVKPGQTVEQKAGGAEDAEEGVKSSPGKDGAKKVLEPQQRPNGGEL